MGGDTRQRVVALRDKVSGLADTLMEFEYDPHAQSLAGDPGYSGTTASTVAEASAAFDRLWLDWARLRDAVTAAEEALDDRRSDDAEVALVIDGRPAEELVESLESDVETVVSAADALRAAREDALPRVNAMVGRIGAIEELAATHGAADDPRVTAARKMVTDAAARLASDPLAVDADAIEAVVAEVERFVRDLAAEASTVEQRLDAGRAQCHELEELIRRGREALERTEDKMAAPGGLLEPLDPQVVDGDDPQALRPWLDRIAAANDRGDWRAAAKGLDTWEQVARGHLNNARRILAANEGPLRRRDELRGLLDAMRAKAAAVGLAENPEVTEAYDQARQVLWVAPCPLGMAERLVAQYRRAVNDRARGGPLPETDQAADGVDMRLHTDDTGAP